MLTHTLAKKTVKRQTGVQLSPETHRGNLLDLEIQQTANPSIAIVSKNMLKLNDSKKTHPRVLTEASQTFQLL